MENEKICAKCGASAPQSNIFCSYCGSSEFLDNAAEAVGQEEAAPSQNETDVPLAQEQYNTVPEQYAAAAVQAVNQPQYSTAQPAGQPQYNAAQPVGQPQYNAAQPVGQPQYNTAQSQYNANTVNQVQNQPQYGTAQPNAYPVNQAQNHPQYGTAQPNAYPANQAQNGGYIPQGYPNQNYQQYPQSYPNQNVGYPAQNYQQYPQGQFANQYIPPVPELPKQRHALGVLGSFLFSLIGGIAYFGIYQLGYIAGICGLAIFMLAYLGYGLFARSKSRVSAGRVISSVIFSLIMICAAEYFCLSFEIYLAYIDYGVTIFDAIGATPEFLMDEDIFNAVLGDLIFAYASSVVAIIISIAATISSARRKKKQRR